MDKKNEKHWVEVYVKKEFSRFGIPEIVGIYYNPYNKSVKDIIKFWIEPEFIHRVYGYKIK